MIRAFLKAIHGVRGLFRGQRLYHQSNCRHSHSQEGKFRYLTSRSSLLGGMDAWKLIRSRMTPPTLGDISHLVGLKIRAIHRLVTARNQR